LHEGDWERVTVLLCPSPSSEDRATVAAALFSAHTFDSLHNCTSGECDFETVQGDSDATHIVVHAALHSHANYPRSTPSSKVYGQVRTFHGTHDGIYAVDRVGSDKRRRWEPSKELLLLLPREPDSADQAANGGDSGNSNNNGSSSGTSDSASDAWARYPGWWGAAQADTPMPFSLVCLFDRHTREGPCPANSEPVRLLRSLLGEAWQPHGSTSSSSGTSSNTSGGGGGQPSPAAPPVTHVAPLALPSPWLADLAGKKVVGEGYATGRGPMFRRWTSRWVGPTNPPTWRASDNLFFLAINHWSTAPSGACPTAMPPWHGGVDDGSSGGQQLGSSNGGSGGRGGSGGSSTIKGEAPQGWVVSALSPPYLQLSPWMPVSALIASVVLLLTLPLLAAAAHLLLPPERSISNSNNISSTLTSTGGGAGGSSGRRSRTPPLRGINTGAVTASVSSAPLAASSGLVGALAAARRWAGVAAAVVRSPRAKAARRAVWWAVGCVASFGMFAGGVAELSATASEFVGLRTTTRALAFFLLAPAILLLALDFAVAAGVVLRAAWPRSLGYMLLDSGGATGWAYYGGQQQHPQQPPEYSGAGRGGSCAQAQQQETGTDDDDNEVAALLRDHARTRVDDPEIGEQSLSSGWADDWGAQLSAWRQNTAAPATPPEATGGPGPSTSTGTAALDAGADDDAMPFDVGDLGRGWMPTLASAAEGPGGTEVGCGHTGSSGDGGEGGAGTGASPRPFASTFSIEAGPATLPLMAARSVGGGGRGGLDPKGHAAALLRILLETLDVAGAVQRRLSWFLLLLLSAAAALAVVGKAGALLVCAAALEEGGGGLGADELTTAAITTAESASSWSSQPPPQLAEGGAGSWDASAAYAVASLGWSIERHRTAASALEVSALMFGAVSCLALQVAPAEWMLVGVVLRSLLQLA
ncbi:hypothetical protein FOA52_013285, partial [Chlamydomonas sp. UWO 241]